MATAFLAALVPVSAGADLLKRGLSLNFDGAASISIPSLGVPAASFVAEDEAIPVQEAPGQPAKLTRHKLACICEATSEVPHDPNAEALIREILVASTGPALDRALLSNTPADDERPAGLFNGIAPLPSAGNLIDNITALASAVSIVAGNGGIAFIGAPAQAVGMNLLA